MRLADLVYAPIARSTRFLSFAFLSTVPFFGLFSFFTAGPAYTINVLGLTPMQFGMLPPIAVCGFLVGLTFSRRMIRIGLQADARYRHRCRALLAAVPIFVLYRIGLLNAALFTACMFTHATGMGIVIPLASAEAIRPFGASAGAASALLGCMQMSGAVAGTLFTSELGAMLGRYAFPEVMLFGAVVGCAALLVTQRELRPEEPAAAPVAG